jgi:hypothetical protein
MNASLSRALFSSTDRRIVLQVRALLLPQQMLSHNFQIIPVSIATCAVGKQTLQK